MQSISFHPGRQGDSQSAVYISKLRSHFAVVPGAYVRLLAHRGLDDEQHVCHKSQDNRHTLKGMPRE